MEWLIENWPVIVAIVAVIAFAAILIYNFIKFPRSKQLEKIQIDVTAEAIQSENFTPNFAANSTNPWPGITAADIMECIYPTHVKYTD